MLFETSITIPKNTTQADPEIEVLKIAHGIITKVMVRPRPGHAALAHCVILHHEHQIAPSTEGMDFHGDTFPIDWEEYYESYQPPYELKLKGWNDDDTYEHTFDVFVAILPRKAVLALAIVDAIKGILGILSPRRIFTRGS
ncbi:unnamed protein product [marine sediment metagenome]|uniref:Uncharacterized protein n=1 Tax=marine sediment metagenome TaxID=412755 RepID=X1RFV9_9ZZZZ